MRVTQKMLSNQFKSNLNFSLRNMERLQQQLSTGKKVSLPSHDPVVAVRSIQYNSQIRELKQYSRNLDTAINWMDTTDNAIQEANAIFKTIREKLVQASNSGALDATSREAIAKEMEELKEQLGSIANTNIAGRYIFSGTETDQIPYQSGNFINSNNSKISVELGTGIFVDINVNGTDLFGFKDSDGNNVFQLMDNIVNTLNANGDTGPLLDKLQVHENNFLRVHASLGANRNRVELIERRLEDQVLVTTEILSNEEDADLAEVIMNLNMEENVYRMALGTGARVIQPTLLDFLR